MSNSNRRLAGFSLELTELKLTGESTNISPVIVGVFTVSWIREKLRFYCKLGQFMLLYSHVLNQY